MMKKSFTLELQKHPLKNVLVTTRGISNTPNTEIALSYQSMYGNSKMLILPVIEWSIVNKSVTKSTIYFCKLCLSQKFCIIKPLNDPNLLNKKSELGNTYHHQSKLLLKSLKKNRYSERNDAMDWFLVFDISSSVFDVSVCSNTCCGILTYSPFQKSIQQELQGGL